MSQSEGNHSYVTQTAVAPVHTPTKSTKPTCVCLLIENIAFCLHNSRPNIVVNNPGILRKVSFVFAKAIKETLVELLELLFRHHRLRLGSRHSVAVNQLHRLDELIAQVIPSVHQTLPGLDKLSRSFDFHHQLLQVPPHHLLTF
eukprot:Skav220123  [mRNA]  locus=scaffold731:116158:119985:+ [translate_table: standard]